MSRRVIEAESNLPLDGAPSVELFERCRDVDTVRAYRGDDGLWYPADVDPPMAVEPRYALVWIQGAAS